MKVINHIYYKQLASCLFDKLKEREEGRGEEAVYIYIYTEVQKHVVRLGIGF